MSADVFAQPGSRGFIAMLEAFRPSGGLAPGRFLQASLAGHRLGDLSGLARLVADRRLFVLDWRGESWIPMFQLDGADLRCRTGPALVRAELDTLASGWALAAWFVRPNALLGGRRPVDVLASDLDGVLLAARSHASAVPAPAPAPALAHA